MNDRNLRRTVRDASDWTPWRWPIDMAATVQEQASCPLDVRVVDLSLSWCRIWAGFRLTPKRPARIVVPGFAPFRGTVLWAENWFAAIEFDRPIHMSVLTHLVSLHPPRADAPFQREANDDC